MFPDDPLGLEEWLDRLLVDASEFRRPQSWYESASVGGEDGDVAIAGAQNGDFADK